MFSKDIARTVYNVFNFQCSTVFSTDPTNAVKLTLDFEKKKNDRKRGIYNVQFLQKCYKFKKSRF